MVSGLRWRNVSIHSFQAEGDKRYRSNRKHGRCFNPLLPSGRRPDKKLGLDLSWMFQSTPSKRKETNRQGQKRIGEAVSIHSFQAEGDITETVIKLRRVCFNPLLPSGRRPTSLKLLLLCLVFQSTPSKRKETSNFRLTLRLCECFNPLLPSGRRPKTTIANTTILPFQSTPSKRKETIVPAQNNVGVFGFNPLLPSGRRHWKIVIYHFRGMFQSTPSKRKETLVLTLK